MESSSKQKYPCSFLLDMIGFPDKTILYALRHGGAELETWLSFAKSSGNVAKVSMPHPMDRVDGFAGDRSMEISS